MPELSVWKSKRYVRGIRAKNAGISLTSPEIELIDQECKWVTEKTGKPFTRTALVRYCLEEYFGEQWQSSLRGALREQANQISQAVKPTKRRAKGSSSTSTAPTETEKTDSPETQHDFDAATPSELEPVTSEVI